MTGFNLRQGADSYEFGLDGSVTKSGQPLGSWSTDQTNRIVVTANDSTETPFDVLWKFNGDNQLCLFSDGNQVFNFHPAEGNSPFYAVSDKAVLQVYPDQDNPSFFFGLHGEWDMTESHDLSVTINGQKSVLDGYVEDEQSRFIYYFFDKQLPFFFTLVFGGGWHNEVGNDGILRMNFQYTREDGSTDTLSLPGEVAIDRTINQLVYEYNKDDHTHRIIFMGLLNVTHHFQLTYTIDRQTSDTGDEKVGSTTLKIDAIVKNDTFSGDLEFLVKKTDGTTGTTTLGIRGNFTAALGDTRLMVGYGFTMVRGPKSVNWSIFFNGELVFKDNGALQWQFQANAQSFTIGIGVHDIRIGEARLDAKLNLTSQNGHVAGVYAMFGVAF